MPYPNEHSARLRDPKDFKEQPDWAKKGQKFARSPDSKIYGNIKVPSTVDVIWGQLKNQSGKEAAPQSLRFPVKNWTATEAKKWLKDNNVKYQRFEPAKKKEKQSMSEAPANACVFNDNAEVSFAEVDEEKKSNTFRIIGYSGGIIKNHWYWGNVAFDLEGIKFAKTRTPVLAEHFRDVRIGFTNKQEISDKVIVEGPFLDNDDAQNLRADMLKGFPMEASLLISPLSVEHVKEDTTVRVNGLKLKGPGSVFRKSKIFEVSMCVFGADSNTKSSAYADSDNQKVQFNLIQENHIMTEETQTITEIESVESFAVLYPDLYAEILANSKAEGQKAERDLFTSLKDACGDDHELLVECFSEGKTAEEAMKLRVDKLEKEKTQLSEKVTEFQKKKPVDPAMTEFTDGSTPPGEKEKGKGNEEAWKQEFNDSADLQAEFGGDVEAYIAFKKADATGNVRITGQK